MSKPTCEHKFHLARVFNHDKPLSDVVFVCENCGGARCFNVFDLEDV